MPTILIKEGKITWESVSEEHPELSRAKLVQDIATLANLMATYARLREEAERVEKQAQAVLLETFPPNIAKKMIEVAIVGGDLRIAVKGVYLGEEIEGGRVYYLFHSDDRSLTRYIQKGLARTLKELPSDKALLFVEKYLAWLGDREDLQETVSLVVSYPNKRILLPVVVEKTDEAVRLMVAAFEVGSGKQLNACYWLDKRAKVGVFSHPGSRRDQTGWEFMLKREEVSSNSTIPLSLFFKIQPSPSGTGISIDSEVHQKADTISLGQPSINQFSHFLARLTYPSGFRPQLGQTIREEQERRFLRAVEEMFV
jgi:hypothetical protein